MNSSHNSSVFHGGGKLSSMSLRLKLTLSIVLFGTLIAGILSALLYTTTRSQMRNDFRQRLLDIVSVGALSIDADVLDSLKDPEQEGKPNYLSVKAVLKKIKANAGDIHFVYTMRADTQGRIMFVVDETDNPDEIAHLGEIYTDASPFLLSHFNKMNTPLVEKDFYTDRWGTWLTGYAPVMNSQGKRAGVLGMDIKAASILSYERKLLVLFLALFIASIVLSSLLGGYLGKRLSAPILTLKERAEQIGMGDFESVIPVQTHDELGVLADSFNMMAAKLKELVGALQNEIHHREAAEKKYRSIFENAMEGMFQSTFGGRLITANPAFSHLLGYASPSEAIEMITDIPHQIYASSDQRREILSILDSEGRLSDYRVKMLKKDGSEVWTELTARAAKEDGREPIVEGLLRDIGEKLAREAAEKEQQMAEAASLAKSEFLANMSHEIRTPMNAVMGLTHLALKTDLTAKQADYLKKILNAGQSLLRIINDILDFSKIEAGKLSIETVPFEMEEIMNNLVDIHGIKSEEKGLELLFQLDPEVPSMLKGDPLRLEQVLTNLVGNAVKFTEKGNIVVSIHTEQSRETDPGDKVRLRFSVKDTGIGLSAKQRERLFASFSQADESVTRKFGGTGLGLSICKSLVEMMDGRIRVESESGIGSTFTFTAVFQKPTEEIRRIIDYPSDLKGMKVLVVDDNSTARNIICEMLESFSFRAYQSPSGTEALNDLEKAQKAGDPYKLVIMDWKMPGMDGIQASESIKNHRDLSDTPSILMLTAYSHEKVQEKAIDVGIDSFLIKPVNPSLLFDAIMAVFHNTSELQTRKATRHKIRVDGLDRVRGASILLVEDYEINRQIATELLESEGFRVQSATNGRLAVEMIDTPGAETAFDLVLMDIQMPEMDGYTATRKIRDLPSEAALIPIVAMTAHALQSEKEKCFAAGMNDHIAKPIDPETLIEVLVKWIRPGQRKPAGTREREKDAGDASTVPLAFENFNQDAGLGRVAGNRKLYLDLLIQFARKYADAVKEIARFLKGDDFENARELAHAVKGMAGNLGAEALQETAERLETALSNGRSDSMESLVEDFGRALGIAVAEISRVEQTAVRPLETGEEAESDPMQIETVATELKALMASDFGAALQKAEILKSLPLPEAMASTVETFIAHLESFEEQQALETLDILLHSIHNHR